MAFKVVQASENIVNKYIDYLDTIFTINDEDYEKQFRELQNKLETFSKGPYLDVTDSFEKGKSINELIEEGYIPDKFRKLGMNTERKLYKHQEIALKKIDKGNNVVVSTGTGSGKTESFLIPILKSLIEEDIKGTLGPGVRALIIYPMNALANDQVERLRDLLMDYPEITYGSYTGQTKQKYKEALFEYKKLNNGKEPVKNELICRDQMIEFPPNILITNYAMLEYLMIRPKESAFFKSEDANKWKYIVMDEAHVYHGSTGIEVSMLLRRLKVKLNNSNTKYILTSATLGGEKDNKEVAKFASDLCDSPFKEENIVRAYRVTPRQNSSLYDYSMDKYSKLADSIDDDNSIKKILNEEFHIECKHEVQSELFDLVVGDKKYWEIRNILIGSPCTLNSISQRSNISVKDLQDFVTVAAKCLKNGEKLFDARYHMFIRAVEGAFITFHPLKKLFLDRREFYYEGGQKYAVFEIAVCSICHSIYLIGEEKNGYLKQSSIIKNIFLLSDKISDDNEDDTLEDEKINAEPYFICSKCGKVFNTKSSDASKCEHGSEFYISVYKIRLEDEKKNLTKCLVCENTNTHGILRSFFTGQEAVTSVIGNALFEELPSSEKSIKVTKKYDTEDEEDEFGFDSYEEDDSESQDTITTQKYKQFIAFSDSRQAAAYYASYFDETYTNILYKRIIRKALEDNNSSKRVEYFVSDIIYYMEKIKLNVNFEKEAYKALLKEIVDNNGVTSMFSMGLIKFSIDEEQIKGLKNLNLSKQEVAGICNIFLLWMMADAALSYPINLNKAEKEFFTNNGIEWGYTFSDSDHKKYVKSFIPTRKNGSNKRLDYILKVLHASGNDMSDEKVKRFLYGIWEKILVNNKYLVSEDNIKYKVNLKKVNVSKGDKWYMCPVCRKTTCYNIKGVCPTFKCNGTLKEIDISEYFKNNHYYKMFMKDNLEKIDIVEHTAQLNKETAYRYQQDFKQKKINILSCSTTFEMGVDVGSLETVFMRNMPPSPSNYAQRAGRAGRSIDSTAYALTFCNKSNHDFTFFKYPEKMIKGEITPPSFNVCNEKIAIRHVYASCFGYFWGKYNQYFSEVCNMIDNDEEGIKKFKEYLNNKPENLKAYLNGFLPQELSRKFGVNNFKWLPKLIGVKGEDSESNGVLTKAVDEYNYEINSLEDAANDARDNNKPADYLYQRINRYKKESILAFLSRKGVLPKYGFPVDTVQLNIIDQNNKNKLGLELQRDLSVAISEYAPSSQVVANNNLITSRYIRKVPKIMWKMYDYKYCEACNTLNIEIHTDNEDKLDRCKCCDYDMSGDKKEVFIIPEFGFDADGGTIKKPGLVKPQRTYNAEVAYTGYNNDVYFEKYSIGKIICEIGVNKGDEMAVLNRSNFYVCEDCGYTHLDKTGFKRILKKEHYKNNGLKCRNNILKKYSLGYRFETDVVQLRFLNPVLDSYEKALSVLYGVIKGMCVSLNIEQNEISGCLSYFYNKDFKRGNYTIILYDKTPGGAGHVCRLNSEQTLQKVFYETYRLMKECNCGGKEGDSSCYGCLRNYYNQKKHDILKRKYVIEFFRSVDCNN